MKTDKFGITIPPRPPCGNLVKAIDNLEDDRLSMIKMANESKDAMDQTALASIAHGMWLAQIHLGIDTSKL